MRPDRASRTALLIARSLTFTRGDPALGQLVPDESAALAWAALEAHSPAGAALHRWLCRPGLRWALPAAERAVIPGIQLHYALRKRFLEEAARKAIAEGTRQVVVVGAGLDALALRLSRLSEAPVCIEVDHPATQRLKRAALERLGGVGGKLRMVAADLSAEALDAALERGGYDPSLRTFFVAEGLSMYLRAEEVRRLLGACRGAPAGSRLAWTLMEPDGEGRIAFRGSRRSVVDGWLRARREPFTWGLARDQVDAFVGTLGLEVEEIVAAPELRARFLDEGDERRPLAEGEIICVVRKP